MALTTCVGLAADAFGDVELEAKLTGDWRWTQVYVTLCLRQKNSLFFYCYLIKLCRWGTLLDSFVKTSTKSIQLVGNEKVHIIYPSSKFTCNFAL